MWNQLEIPKMWRIVAGDYHDLGFQFVDQCVLNFLFKNSYAVLPSKFNFLAAVPQKKPSENVSIIHFAGGTKPWHYSSFSLRSFISVLKSRDVSVYKRIQNELIQEVEKSSKNNAIALSNISSRMTEGIGLSSLIKHRIFVRPFLYPYFRKLSRSRKFLTGLLLKTLKGSNNI
jgi:lipopolysaccharide biosynthesis glycosyltransferase